MVGFDLEPKIEDPVPVEEVVEDRAILVAIVGILLVVLNEDVNEVTCGTIRQRQNTADRNAIRWRSERFWRRLIPTLFALDMNPGFSRIPTSSCDNGEEL